MASRTQGNMHRPALHHAMLPTRAKEWVEAVQAQVDTLNARKQRWAGKRISVDSLESIDNKMEPLTFKDAGPNPLAFNSLS